MSPRSLLASSVEPRSTFALFEKGFRPFFLLGAAFATLAVPLWMLALLGGFSPGGSFGPMQWHAHEMLFGFSSAIVAGFLLTAVSNWTGRETASGASLAGLSLLWVLGRVALFFAGALPRLVPAFLDIAFFPALAFVCARPLLASGNRRNYAFIALLSALSLINLSAHAGALSENPELVRTAHRVALDVMTLMMALVSGRVIPMFTRNSTKLAWVHGNPVLEWASSVCLLLLAVCDAWHRPESYSATLAGAAGIFLLARMHRWGSRHTLGEPLLWILHAGALWLPLGLLLRAGASLGAPIPPASALHALTAGAIGALTLGMMVRVSLGHTGRMLKAPRLIPIAFGSVLGAGVVRVAANLLPAKHYLPALELASLAWAIAFGLFIYCCAAMLTSPRVDGR